MAKKKTKPAEAKRDDGGHLGHVSRAIAAIDAVFGDTSVSRGTTRDSLNELRDYIDDYLRSLDDTDKDADEAELNP
jgi:hypothetical protein